MTLLSIASVPVFVFIGILFRAVSSDLERTKVSKASWFIAFVQLLLAMSAFGLCARGTMSIISKIGRPPEGEIFYLTVPLLCLFALGMWFWESGFRQGKESGTPEGR